MLKLDAVARESAIFAVREFRDFRALRDYLKSGGEIDSDIRALLVAEVERLAETPSKFKGSKRSRAEVLHKIEFIRRILFDPVTTQDLAAHAIYADLLKYLGFKDDLTRKAAAKKAAHQIVIYEWKLAPSALKRMKAKPKNRAKSTSEV